MSGGVLWIAEKGSIVKDAILPVIGGANDEESKGYIRRGNNHFVWLDGHALANAEPDYYLPDSVPRGKNGNKIWRAEDLPILPAETEWALIPDEKKVYRINRIRALLRQCEVVHHVGDPDKEGQLIIDEVLEYLHNCLPVRRILINDYNRQKVSEALSSMRDNEDPLFRAWHRWALARNRYDWCLGMNGTRAMTIRAQEEGCADLMPIGSVQTPLLFIVRERDRVIESFVAKPYFVLTACYQYEGVTFKARWLPGESQQGLDDEKKLIDKAIAQQIAEKTANVLATVAEYDAEEMTADAPLPLALDELQMEASRLYGYTAQETLDIAQRLYERYKVITYPRTDVRYLSEAQHTEAAKVFRVVTTILPELSNLIDSLDVSVKSKAFDDKMMLTPQGEPLPHHATVPTAAEHIDTSRWIESDFQIYGLVARQYLMQFAAAFRYLKSNAVIEMAGEKFGAGGTKALEQGWKALQKDEKVDNDDQQTLPLMKIGEVVSCTDVIIKDRETTPPPRFDEVLLLQALKNIHKFIDGSEDPDKRLRNRLKNRHSGETPGLGTTATRGAIIREAKERGLLVPAEKKNKLMTSARARALIDALPGEVKSPTRAALIRQAFDRVAEGEITMAKYLNDIGDYVREIVSLAKTMKMNLQVEESASPCPRCGSKLLVQSNRHVCGGCDYQLRHTIAGKVLSTDDIEQLLAKKSTRVLKGFTSKAGRKFAAALEFDADFQAKFRFEQEQPIASQIDAKCPKCGHALQADGRAYKCSSENNACDFKVWTEISGRIMTSSEIADLLNTGLIGPLSGFKSRKTGKPFKAALKLSDAGKVEFQFN